MPPGGIEPPSFVPKTSTLSVELRRRFGSPYVNYTEIGTIVNEINNGGCSSMAERCSVAAEAAGSIPVGHPHKITEYTFNYEWFFGSKISA